MDFSQEEISQEEISHQDTETLLHLRYASAEYEMVRRNGMKGTHMRSQHGSTHWDIPSRSRNVEGGHMRPSNQGHPVIPAEGRPQAAGTFPIQTGAVPQEDFAGFQVAV